MWLSRTNAELIKTKVVSFLIPLCESWKQEKLLNTQEKNELKTKCVVDLRSFL